MNAEMIRRIERLSREGANRDPWDHARSFLEIRAAVELEAAGAKPPLLSHLLPWSDEEQTAAAKIAEAGRRLAATGAAIVERCLRQDATDEQFELIEDVIGSALACHCSALKWSAMAHEKSDIPYYEIHALYHLAEIGNVHRSPRLLDREGSSECLSAEARYIHAALLPLFIAPHFDRQKIEVADALLASWAREYSVCKTAASDDVGLWVDLGGQTRPLVAQYRPDGHGVRLIVLSKMLKQMERAMRAFNSGKMPASGITADFRLEAHVEVLDHLRLLWDRLEGATAPRDAPRSAAQLPGASLYLNLAELLAGARTNPDAAVRIEGETDAGLRVIVDKTVWDRVEPGQLVGLHAQGESFLGVAHVTRKLEAPRAFEWHLAVEWICRAPRPLILQSRESTLVPRKIPALYLPGAEPSGRTDLLLMADRTTDDESYDASLCGRRVTLQLQRPRHKGHGWVAAEFAVTSCSGSPGTPAAAQG
jgi:hypothetical protein